jgi:uncharacterized protein (TIGR02265 family)
VSRIRGQTVLNTVRFVKQRFGDDAHARVLQALPAEAAGMFLAPIGDSSWKSLPHTVAYMRAAQALLAPADATFHKELGRFSGRATGESSFRLFIGGDPQTAVTRSAFIWRFLYDTGRVDVVESSPGGITIRLRDFDAGDRAWCQRIEGFLEAVMEIAGAREPQVVERECIHLGAAHCEMHGSWR